MNRLLIAFIFTFCSLRTFGQESIPNFPIDSVTGKISYTEVVYLDSTIHKQELHSRAMEWFAKAYKSSKSVIQLEDKDAGKIIAKALMPVKMRNFAGQWDGGFIHYTFSIYLRDGRYKYVISDFYHEGMYSGGCKIPDGGALEKVCTYDKGFCGNSFKGTWLYLLQQTDIISKSLIADLKKSMANPSVGNTSDDW